MSDDPVKNAERLSHSYLAGGADSAVQNMQREYENSRGDFKSESQHKQYWKNVASELSETGHLPNMTVAYLDRNKGQFDQNNDGVISKTEVNRISEQDGFASIFANELKSTSASPKMNKTFYDQLAHTTKQFEFDPNAIEDADLNRWGRQNNRVLKRELRADQAYDAASPLYENNGALLHALDASRKENGRISKSDYKAFLKDYKQKAANGEEDEVYNERNASFVRTLLNGDQPLIKHMGPLAIGRGINIDKLDRRTGLAPVDDFSPHTDIPEDGISKSEQKYEDQLVEDALTEKEEREKANAKPKDNCDNELKNKIDSLATLRPNEGYSHVACRLLDIKIDGHYTAEQKREMDTLATQLKNITTGHNTHRLYKGFIVPVSNNLEKLEAINPTLKARMDAMRGDSSTSENDY